MKFMKGRYINENTRFTYHCKAFTKSKNIPGLHVLVLRDFEKAFDFISWHSSFIRFIFFSFGKIYWIKILNTNFIASVLQYGYLSEQI